MKLKWWQNSTNRLRLIILAGLLAGAIIPLVWSITQNAKLSDLALNFGTEMSGAAITFILLDWLIGGRERREAQHEEEEILKYDLIARMGSNVKEVAASAVDELHRRGWLTDGTLCDATLRRANLQGANLAKADLHGANLHRASLQEADLWGAVLQSADLSGAWLTEARLWQVHAMAANLWQARLHKANLKEADLRDALLNETRMQDADLRGADLTGANLQHANLNGAQFDAATMMPDGNHWAADTDITRFTDPNHPQCWHPQMIPNNEIDKA